MRLTREAALCLQRWMTSLLPELHDWREVGNTGGGKGPVVKSAASHATPVPVTPDHMPPCAAKPCHSSFPLGKTKTPFRPVPTVIMQSRSNLFLLAAHCEVTQPFPCYSFAGLCNAQPARLILLCEFSAWSCLSWKGHEDWDEPSPQVSVAMYIQCGFWS